MRTCKQCNTNPAGYGATICNQCRDANKINRTKKDIAWWMSKRKLIDSGAYEMKNYCEQCGCNEDLTIDHIKPRSKGGSDDPSNLRTLCRMCNSKKGNR